jgi:hypothetical protein
MLSVVIADETSAPGVGLVVGQPIYPYSLPSTLSIPVTRGAEVVIDALAFFTIKDPITFTISSSLAP